MPERDWQQYRADLIEMLRETASNPQGIIALVLLAALVVCGLVITAVLLRLFERSLGRVSIPKPAWRGPDVILALVGWFVLQIVLGSFAFSLLPPLPSTEAGVWIERTVRIPLLLTVQLIAGAIGGLTVSGALLLLPRVHGQPLTTLGIGTGSLGRGFGQGALVWLCAIPGGLSVIMIWSYGLLRLGAEPDPQPVVELFRSSFGRGDVTRAGLVILFGVGIAPVVEELLFRAVLFRWLAVRFGVTLGVTISALVFGLIHGSLHALLPITLLGALLALLYHRTGNIWSCIGLHTVFNAGQFALMMLLTSLGVE